MPGITGFATIDRTVPAAGLLQSMQELMRHRAAHAAQRQYTDGRVWAGTVSAGRPGADSIGTAGIRAGTGADRGAGDEGIETGGAGAGGVVVWMDGEIYNSSDIFRASDSRPHGTAAHTLAALYRDGALDTERLARIDGFFAAALYDPLRRRIFLVTDRYGMRHLYWSRAGGHFAWSSECKAFLALPGFSPSVDRQALSDFLTFGYLTGQRTWFDGATLLEPATVLECDIDTGETVGTRYWSWDRIAKLEGRIDWGEAAREWGRRFELAVKRRCGDDGRVGVTLSGGLDSRAILAAMPGGSAGVDAVTFGMRGCADIVIARRAAAIKGAHHHVFECGASDWLAPNIASVWCTDGELGLTEPCGAAHLKAMYGIFDVSLNGIGGDAVHGGSFASMKGQSARAGGEPYGDRGRRYIRQGFRYDESFGLVRMPFYDNSLMEFAVSIPEPARAHASFYRQALLTCYPRYFRTVPWQKAGVAIGVSEPLFSAASFLVRVPGVLGRAAKRAGFPFRSGRRVADYDEWLRTGPALTFLDGLFTDAKALYPGLIERRAVVDAWRRHLSRADRCAEVGRYATVEIWLRQAFEKKFRPEL